MKKETCNSLRKRLFAQQNCLRPLKELVNRGTASFDEKSETVIFSEGIESVTGRPLEYEIKVSLPQGHLFLSFSQFANPTDRDKKDENQVDSANRIRKLTPDELEHENTEIQIGNKNNKFPLQPLEEERNAGLGDLSLLLFRLTPKKLAETEIDSRLPHESFSLLKEGKISGSLSNEDDSTSFRGKGEDGRDLDQRLSDSTLPTDREAKGDGSVLQDVGSSTFGDQRLVPRHCWPFGRPQSPKDDEGNPKDDTFSKQALKSHNYYRKIHQAADLQLDKQISAYAQDWAEYLAAQGGDLQHRSRGKYGENLWGGGGFVPTGHDPVDTFYKEEQYYKRVYGYEPSDNIRSAAGHFTQLVWLGSERLGVGLAQSPRGRWVAVFNYEPRGNWGGSYKENVLAPTKVPDKPPTVVRKQKQNEAAGSVFPDGLIPSSFFGDMGLPRFESQESSMSKSRPNFGSSASGLRKSKLGSFGSKSFKDVAAGAKRTVKSLAGKLCGSSRKSKKERRGTEFQFHDFPSYISQGKLPSRHDNSDGDFGFAPTFPISGQSLFSPSLSVGGQGLFAGPPRGRLFPHRLPGPTRP